MRAFTLVAVLALAACGSKSPGAGGGTGNHDGRCTRGEYFVPGCSDEPGIVAGCYERCAFGATCAGGTTCTKATVMPACALAEGDVACDACGEEVELCLPGGVE